MAYPRKPVKTPRKRNHRQESLTRLRQRFETENEGEKFSPESEPEVTPILKYAEGGIPRILQALRAHDDDDARDFIELYDSLTAEDRENLSLEEIACASGVGSLRLAEISLSASILHGQMTSKLILASSLPTIVSTSVRMAKTRRGVADREMMLKAGGILPLPKGTQINVAGQVTNGSDKSQDSEPIYLDPGQRLKMIHEAVEQRRLPAPPSTPIDIGGRLDHMQIQTAEILEADDV